MGAVGSLESLAPGEAREVLIVDADDKVQRGLSQLLVGSGLLPTVVSDPAHARELARERSFAVALVDIDTPRPGAGVAIVRELREAAPATTVIVMAPRKLFDNAVEAFRAGAADLILKQPDQVEHLRRRVVEACAKGRGRADETHLLDEALAVQEEFLRRLMESARHAAELEERLGGEPAVDDDGECRVLVVEPSDDGWLAGGLRKALGAGKKSGVRLTLASTGGEGLDRATAGHYHIALVCAALPDLPGSMVVNTFKAQSPETIAILYTRPGDRGPGKAEVIEGSKAIQLVPQLSDARQMVERIDELKSAFVQRARERRTLAAFRQHHYDLLKRFAELKQKIQGRKA